MYLQDPFASNTAFKNEENRANIIKLHHPTINITQTQDIHTRPILKTNAKQVA
ncbi:hypothetical protein Hanom_Chr17g01540671 [Helianthus anomalus]